MGLAAWDSASLYVSYSIAYLYRMSQWPKIGSGFIVASTCWLGISYLVGRYSPDSGVKPFRFYLSVMRIGLPAIAILVVFVGHSWVYGISDAITRFRGFLVPFLGILSLLSMVGQGLVARFSRRKKEWIIVCSQDEASLLEKEYDRDLSQIDRKVKMITRTDDFEGLSSGEIATMSCAVGESFLSCEKTTEQLLSYKEQGLAVIPLLNWAELILQRIPPELVSRGWLVGAEGFSLRPGGLNWRIKRLGDVVGSALLIIVTMPIVLIFCLLIWIEDRGPLIYRQVRTGQYGKRIVIWKLRSMKVNAEDAGIQWAKKEDPRITRIGRIIRATRVDELPQLVSVLSGDLSLIGPRPERPEIDEKLEKKIPHYRVRHWIRPGLSGWAQVSYPYGASVEDSRMKLSYDLYYIRNASLLLDVLITMKTIRLVLSAEGASPKGQIPMI